MQLKIFFFFFFLCVCVVKGRQDIPVNCCTTVGLKNADINLLFFFKINCKKKIYSNSSLVDHVLGEVYRYRTPPVVHRRKKAPK